MGGGGFGGGGYGGGRIGGMGGGRGGGMRGGDRGRQGEQEKPLKGWGTVTIAAAAAPAR